MFNPTPRLLFAMPLSEALRTALAGMFVVVSILALLSVLITLTSKILSRLQRKEDDGDTVSLDPVSVSVLAPANNAPELIGTDDRTAAVLMAIVSEQSGMPLEKLRFKRIRLLDR